MIEDLRAILDEQIAVLNRELRIELPKRIATATALGDLRENAEYTSALERQEFVRARISQLTRRQSELSRINLKDVPFDRVGFGSQVEAEDESGSRYSWSLVFPEFIGLDDTMVSLASPLGRALLGSQPGDDVELESPDGTRRFRVIEVVTLHGERVSDSGAAITSESESRGDAEGDTNG